MGVWIETARNLFTAKIGEVTPFVGVWIETDVPMQERWRTVVTPFVGVWIETRLKTYRKPFPTSHPSWVCGLKHLSHDS